MVKSEEGRVVEYKEIVIVVGGIALLWVAVKIGILTTLLTIATITTALLLHPKTKQKTKQIIDQTIKGG